MGLRIKTLNGIETVERPPNGGWAWLVVFATFNNMGIGFGIPKSLGVYFNEMRDDLGVGNTAISWLLTFIMSMLTFSGLFAQVLRKWLDDRQIVMLGGLMSCTGMVICSFAPNIFVAYLCGFIMGTGYGLASITCMTQVSQYFSTNTALANGIGLSGSTLYGVILPYPAQYLLGEFGWRGSFLILGAISLNACVFGALIHPIAVMKDPDKNGKDLNTVREESCIENSSVTPVKDGRINRFFKKYWLGLCFIFADVVCALSMYLPNVYIVPYALELGFSESSSALLLSVISVGDFVGRFFSGLAISKSAFLRKSILQLTCLCFGVMTAVQFIPTTSSNFALLAFYCVTYGCAFGVTATTLFTIAAIYSGPSIRGMTFTVFFAAAGLALLISGALSGVVVDLLGNFTSVFWLTMILAGTTSLLFTACTMTAFLHNNGQIVFSKSNSHEKK
uniref:Monocarboxylate transporter 2 n=1 Tax=Phallusia mammillata TaxID=59560 RepID=A0A6F9DSX7_9ASCI|nr:monocarboxylate transporter 2 [Phallusia mammillata]